jgi:hypothetical protein
VRAVLEKGCRTLMGGCLDVGERNTVDLGIGRIVGGIVVVVLFYRRRGHCCDVSTQ